MRRATFPMVAVAVVALSGCGGGSSFANRPRPASPVNLSVYINNSRVSVSPASVGAGEVVFLVTNQASQAESVSIHAAGGSQALASTGPINPQGTSQVAVDFSKPGSYSVSTSGGGANQTDAAQANPPSIAPANLTVGPARPNSSDQLLQP